MNITVIIIETVVMTLAFTAMILIPLVRNPVWWIHDYPKDIQDEYFKTHERVPSEFFSKTVLIKKGCAVLFALVVLLALMKLAGAYSFLSAFVVSYGIWLFIDWYDCFFLDWVLFANLKAVQMRRIAVFNVKQLPCVSDDVLCSGGRTGVSNVRHTKTRDGKSFHDRSDTRRGTIG